jgi:RHS repeat-associated protein
VLWPLVDHLGTVRDLAEYDSGTGDTVIVNHITYDAYGGSRAETNAAVDHLFGYTGREWDAEADLQYNRARWYDPAVGRWLSEDPIGFEAGDGNLSRYVGNEATAKTDPSGLEERPYIIGPDGKPFYLSSNLPYPHGTIFPPEATTWPPVDAPSISQASPLVYETWQQRALRRGHAAWVIIMVQTGMPGGGAEQAIFVIGGGLPGTAIAKAGGARPYVRPIRPAHTSGQPYGNPPVGLQGRPSLTPREHQEFDAFAARARALGLVENGYRTGNWGTVVNGRFREICRIDVGERGMSGYRGITHIHVNGGPEHLPFHSPLPGE